MVGFLKGAKFKIDKVENNAPKYEFDIEYVKGKDIKVVDFLRRLESDNERTEDCDIRSLCEISEEMATVQSQQEADGSTNFFISDSFVNKYRTQIRILKTKQREHEILYRKYNIIYVSEKYLRNDHYLNDLFRRTLKNEKICIYYELPDNLYCVV